MSSETKKRMKRAKPQPAPPEADEEPPPPKKVRKVKAAVAVVARKEPAVLGSLPLYGEELPDGGFDNIPLAAKEACKGLKEVLSKIRAMEGDLSPGAKVGFYWDFYGHCKFISRVYTCIIMIYRIYGIILYVYNF